MFLIVIAVFVIGYALIALEHPLNVNKTATALILGVVIWTLYAFAGESIFSVTGYGANFEHFKLLNPDKGFMDFITKHEMIEHLGDISEILFFLLGAMTIVEVVDQHNGFAIITDKISTQSKSKLLWILSFLTFFLSAILDNLTTSIVMCALLRKLIADKQDRWFFAGMVILAANAGGAWSPIGDVTTIMLWIGGQVSAVNIILKTFVASLVCMVVPLAIISLKMKGNVVRPSLSANTTDCECEKEALPRRFSSLVFCIGIGGLLFVPIFKSVTHLPPYLGMLFSLGVLWVVTELLHYKHPERCRTYTCTSIISKIDTPSILFFLGILLAVAGLQSMGHLSLLSKTLDSAFQGNIYVVNILIGLLSSIVDNVPLVAGAMGMYPVSVYPMDHTFWEFLAYCAGTGGSILIIGSAAGVAVMGMEKIDFIWYLKKISIWALLGYFCGAVVFYLMQMFFFA